MYVVVIGGGMVGGGLVRRLMDNKHDVVLVEDDKDLCNALYAETGVLAKSFDVPEVIVRMRNPDYRNAYRLAGATKIIRVTDLMVNQMMIFIENPQVRRITAIGGGKADVFVVIVPDEARVAGKSIVDITSDSDFPAQCVFVAVYNQARDEFCIPRGNQVIGEGDELFLISPAEDIKQVVDLLTRKA
ncbi:MAG: TrkA family potassium uptake protein [Sedimentisphaerales bacterium]|nr:TrkA family potassium uptake protein [Sedimentisphaerales bacterium]